MKKAESYQHDKTATCTKSYVRGVLGNRVLTEKTSYYSSDGSALQSTLQSTYKFSDVKRSAFSRLRIFLTPHFLHKYSTRNQCTFSTLYDYCKRPFQYIWKVSELLKVQSETVEGVGDVWPVDPGTHIFQIPQIKNWAPIMLRKLPLSKCIKTYLVGQMLELRNSVVWIHFQLRVVSKWTRLIAALPTCRRLPTKEIGDICTQANCCQACLL